MFLLNKIIYTFTVFLDFYDRCERTIFPLYIEYSFLLKNVEIIFLLSFWKLNYL